MIEVYWDFWYGGLAIAAISIFMTVFTGKFLMVSKGYAGVCSVLSKKPFFHSPDIGGFFGWRSLFIYGIAIGGLLAALTSQQGFVPSFAYGKFDVIFGDSLAIKALVLIFGGFLWGYGARVARGCTSGNSISAISKGSVAGLLATIGFMVAGVVVTFTLNYIAGAL